MYMQMEMWKYDCIIMKQLSNNSHTVYNYNYT